MQVERIPFPSVERGDHKGLPFHTEPNVREETGIKNCVNIRLLI